MSTREATITVGGVELTPAQSMAVRCAVAHFLTNLDDPEYRAALGGIADGYRARLCEVQALIMRSCE